MKVGYKLIIVMMSLVNVKTCMYDWLGDVHSNEDRHDTWDLH